MDQLEQLKDRIIRRVNVNLSELGFDTEKFVLNALEYDKLLKFYACYEITEYHPIYFNFKNSNIAGSYFLGKCHVKRSVIYKSDIRGDELKRKGDNIPYTKNVPLVEDEMFAIRDSILYKTLVHSNSHDLESPEEFNIANTISAHYVNIHGSPIEGCFLGPFATVDIMNLHSCIIGEFSYVHVGELFHTIVAPGTIWLRNKNFEFKYKFEKEILEKFIGVNSSYQPRGIIYDFVKEREGYYERLFDVVDVAPVDIPASSSLNRYAVIRGKVRIGENVLVAQKAFLDNAIMGDGSNAQENSYIVDSNLEGLNITAHGGKIINANIGKQTFVGFNSFLNGKPDAKIEIGARCVVMPHTIIDSDILIKIPDDHLIWGFIGSPKDIKDHTISFDEFIEAEGGLNKGKMTFNGKGTVFINSFRERIYHILLSNGALFENGEKRGHAQDQKNISFNIIRAYSSGERKGLYPYIKIKP